ncbi:MAG: TlpA family protein disulfide reductase [Chitinophagaceae bacterium]|nr:MAG: TlpA family protein disulfide reductase [Chitinophagaceae bacterium]
MRVLTTFFAIALFVSSCKEEKNYGAPVVKPEAILKSLMNYLAYNERYVQLWDEFTPLDEGEKVISKETFLQKLNTGEYLPLRLSTNDSTIYYQLYKIPATADQGILSSVKSYAQIDLEFFQMEGKHLPAFNFTDLNGHVYNKESIMGKTLVLKCWFINCVPCVKEMPELNQLVKQYSKRNDLLFVSLAFDSPEKLKTFLSKTKFDYAVVGNQEDYLLNQLKISGYPTHLVVNDQGKILKVVNNYKELEAVLKKFS